MKKNRFRTAQTFRLESLETRNLLAADLISVSPADDGTAGVADHLVLTFGEEVQPGPGLGNIIVNSSDGSVVEAVNVHSDQVTFDGATVTVDLSADLPSDSEFFVTIDPGAVRDKGVDVSSTVLMDEDFEDLPLKNSDFDSALDNYVVVMTGTLDVKEEGAYTFGVNSDDGQWLMIDLAQDGIDAAERFDDEIIFDNTTHGRQDRLSVCGIETTEQSCVGGGDDPIELEVGEYAFEYWYFEAGGGSGGEFFYAKGLQEEFNEDEFVLVGDDSKGIGVTEDGILGTTHKSASEEIGSLDPAAIDLVDGAIDQAEGYPASAPLATADVHNTGGSGRFTDDHGIPGFEDPSDENFTDVPPFGWTKDNSELPEGGPAEYAGWSFMDKDVWVLEQGDQSRTNFTKGEGVVALVDPDAYDDFVEVNDTDFVAAMSTPAIYLDGVAENTATLSLDSSWYDEDFQSAELRVEFFDAEGSSIREDILFRWDSESDSEFFRAVDNPEFDADGGGDARNEAIRDLALNNPADAASLIVTFDMPQAGNDWWWAVDNIVVKADVAGEVHEGIDDDTSWNFSTGGDTPSENWMYGDFNGDGEIGFADFQILSTNFGKEVEDPNDGDSNGDGSVTFADFQILSTNFGKSVDEVMAQL